MIVFDLPEGHENMTEDEINQAIAERHGITAQEVEISRKEWEHPPPGFIIE